MNQDQNEEKKLIGEGKKRNFACGGILLDLLVFGNKRKKRWRGTFKDVFVQGHAATLMWIHRQQSEYKSCDVQMSLCALK